MTGLPFDVYLRTPQVRSHRDALQVASEALPDPFNDALDLFEAVGWRLLHYAGRMPWACACAPDWDPRSDFAALAATGANHVPADMIGGDPEDAAAGVRLDLGDTHVDPTRAGWLIIGFVQSLQLSPPQVLSLRWWEPPFWKPALRDTVKGSML